MPDLLLIDDDPVVVPAQVRHAFPPPNYNVRVASDGASGLAQVQQDPPDVILLDLRLPDRSGLEVYADIRAIDARIPVVFVTMAKTADTAIEAMKHGAFDYLCKPLDLTQLRATVREALEVERRMRAPVKLESDADADDTTEGIIFGGCPGMVEVYKAIGRVASKDVTVLLTGESGTGKELVARALYQHSARASAPFLALNCAAIPEALLESELFGHEKSSFTGADRRRIGKFEQCNGGTILLDEVGDMPLVLQAKLLRLLQSQTFERVGGNETIRTNVRLIASTHRDLKALAAEDKFRSDLYYRLSVFAIHLPPLRDRGDDIPMLVSQMVRRYRDELGHQVQDIAPDAMDRLRSYTWPGNVRELQSVLKQALLHASGSILLAAHLPDLAAKTVERAPPAVAPARCDLDDLIRQHLDSGDEDAYAQTHRELDRRLLTAALEQTGGNQREAARLLGISRQTMRAKQRALGLHVSRSVELDDPETS